MLKVGIIGCGGIATFKHMPSLKKIKEVQLVAFCDRNIERAKKAAADFGVDGAKVYDNYEEMLKTESLDVIHVCTPNKSHAPISIAAMEAGCHVMCEKPMAKTVKEAEEMLECAKKTGKKLTIGYQNRFRQDSMYLKKSIEAGELGEIYFSKAHAIRRRAVPTWGVFLDKDQQGGGPLIDMGTHAVDLCLWLMDNYNVKTVKGSVFKKLGKSKNQGNIWGDWDPEKFDVEDSAFGFITMENGATVIVESSWALNTLDTKEGKVTLCGTEAGADMNDGLRINKIKFNKQTVEKPDLSDTGIYFLDGNPLNENDLEAASWINAIINDTDPVVKPEQALVVTKVLEAIYESAETGKEIEF